MLIRKIQPADNPSVAAIIREVMTEFGAVGDGFSIQDAEVDAMFEAYQDPRSVFYVLYEEQVIGCGGIARLAGGDEQTCELKKMYFQSQARGRGFGRVLGEMLVQDARRLEYRRVYIETLKTMQAANRLYQKLGFTEQSSGLGDTGHCGCDTFYVLDIDPIDLAPELLA